ncbi:MAG TPA: TonB-dependent receptor plug domain-containing protein [Rhodanobacteraceae bacterium]
MALFGCSGLASGQAVSDLGDLSIEELSEIEVTSVSRRPEPIRDAPAAIYVISGEDIRRSGAVTLAEALRLAPNLEVARVNSQSYAISSRGLNSVNASNKLLGLIDVASSSHVHYCLRTCTTPVMNGCTEQT